MVCGMGTFKNWYQNWDIKTILCLSSTKRDPKIFRLIVGQKWNEVNFRLTLIPSDVSRLTEENETPLHFAMKTPSFPLSIATKLVNDFPDAITTQDTEGQTPLAKGIYYNKDLDDELVRLVLVCRPEVAQMRDYCGEYPLHDAGGLTSRKAFRVILEAFPAAARDKDNNPGWLPLHRFVITNVADDRLEDLIEVYPEALFVRDNSGKTPLNLVKSERVKRLLNRKIQEKAFSTSADAENIETKEMEKESRDKGRIKSQTRNNTTKSGIEQSVVIVSPDLPTTLMSFDNSEKNEQSESKQPIKEHEMNSVKVKDEESKLQSEPKQVEKEETDIKESTDDKNKNEEITNLMVADPNQDNNSTNPPSLPSKIEFQGLDSDPTPPPPPNHDKKVAPTMSNSTSTVSTHHDGSSFINTSNNDLNNREVRLTNNTTTTTPPKVTPNTTSNNNLNAQRNLTSDRTVTTIGSSLTNTSKKPLAKLARNIENREIFLLGATAAATTYTKSFSSSSLKTQNESYRDRINLLEIAFFGSKQTGSLISRLNGLFYMDKDTKQVKWTEWIESLESDLGLEPSLDECLVDRIEALENEVLDDGLLLSKGGGGDDSRNEMSLATRLRRLGDVGVGLEEDLDDMM